MSTSQSLSDVQLLLSRFWYWAEYDAEAFAKGKTVPEPFYFPRFEELRAACLRQINGELSDAEMDDFLTCLALDNEEERILDACKENANADFIARLTVSAIRHPQPHARWQAAELLLCRETESRMEILHVLMEDLNAYVRKRAEAVWKILDSGNSV